MDFLHRIFGKKKLERHTSRCETQRPVDPTNDPNMIKAFDGYGREIYITKQQWKDHVLISNLEKMRNDPDHLYGMLVCALQDGFAADVIPYAEHLWRTDPIPSRGTTVLGIAYMTVNRLDDAQRVLNDYIIAHGEDGVVLTNLAKVYSSRGDEALARSTLWHALEVEPNQDNGLQWYVAIQRDHGGEASALDALRRIAALPHSWRALLWLARHALQNKDLASAETLYQQALVQAGSPVPSDLLMQMSGDLGNHGYLVEILHLVGPWFDPAIHGLQVGNNLIKAHCEVGQTEEARHIVRQLYAQQRHDWQETLHYWETELAKAETVKQTETTPEQLSVSLMTITGPLWTREESPFAKLLPTKHVQAPQIALFGSTVLPAQVTAQPALQLADNSGRLSRAIPLFFAEKIHLTTDAAGTALIPWAQHKGFAVFGHPYNDHDLCALARTDFVVGVTLDATQSTWKLSLGLVRVADGQRMAEAQIEVTAENPGPSVVRLSEEMVRLLVKHAGVHTSTSPSWYQIPSGEDSSDYLLRLEQQLAVACMHSDSLIGGRIFGEHEMLDGILHLCARHPANQTVRMVFAQTLRDLQKVYPAILSEYKQKIGLLQSSHPLNGNIGQLVDNTIAEAVSSKS